MAENQGGGGVFVWLLLVREKGGFSAGKRKEKKGLRGETREGSFLSSFWREDIFEKETREREKNRRDFCLRKERKMRIAEEVY